MSTATTTPAGAPEQPQEKERRRRPRLRIVLVAVGVLGAAAIGAYLFLSGGTGAASDDVAAPAAGEVVEVGTLTTNLAGAPARYVRVGVALVLAEDVDAEAVAERFALVKDAAITELGQHDAETLQTSGGSEVLRDGLTERVMTLYPDGEVLRVALTDLLIQ